MGGTGSGRRPLEKKAVISSPDKLRCMACNEEYGIKEFYTSDSDLFLATGRIPYCRSCLEKFYNNYLDKYKKLSYPNPERKAIERLCMVLNLYYSDKIFDAAEKKKEERLDTPLLASYFQIVKLIQYRKKDYDSTIYEKYKSSGGESDGITMRSDSDAEYEGNVAIATEIFGSGYSNEDYVFLYKEYCDWTARHECETKAQEEVFKQICLTQLQLHKTTVLGKETKDLQATFQKLLDTAKLQPKQNAGSSESDAQTLGTLIDKWENTRPLPEIDEELKDVDKIGLYIDVFFRGHLAKMMGLKNGLSSLYEKFMKKYTVNKPEYDSDEGNEALFDAIFGSAINDE